VNVPAHDRGELVDVLATLSNLHRLKVVAALSHRRNYVSQLARELGISRALLQAHLRKLEAVGLVSAQLELSGDGKVMKFYEVAPFVLHLTPETIADSVLKLGSHETVQRTGEEGSSS
jgi:predicted transcriptional regulator